METAIPIIVTRLNEQQIKQIFTHRDSLKPPHKFSSQPESKRDGFNTIDQSQQQKIEKSKNVRVRRIQSSGGRRRLPKDFFSRQSRRPSKKSSLKTDAKTVEHQAQETGCFQNQDTNEKQEYDMETPKFRQKYIDRAPIQLAKNETIPNSNNSQKSINRVKIRSRRKTSRSQKDKLRQDQSPNKQGELVTCFQNTFSANQFNKIPQWTCKPFEIQLLKQKTNLGNGEQASDKENMPMKKPSKSDSYREAQMKKMSLIKERTGYFKTKNLTKIN